ncbi:MAG: alanine--tRNA ligase-related protein [Candidatus Saccharibacteria bacterium]|nr:alanine--tRNA ligase-related protein [Candidatus Saccharibacteria bacterium]
MTSKFIRQAYLRHMQKRDHALIGRASLVLQNDPTTLFTGSGMQPLLPYLLGESHPQGQRLANSQICLRTQDIDEVGDNSHTTCFEMLGNWSLGDYFKKDQLTWFFNFLVDDLKLDVNRLYVTCFRGDDKYSLKKDFTSAHILQGLYQARGLEAKIVDLISADQASQSGMQDGRIFYYNDDENWWSRGGGIDKTPLGDPAGGDCEFFFDFGNEYHNQDKYGLPHPASDSGRFLEIGNSVFMEYQKTETGFQSLKSKNVDFGGGLERLVAASLNQPDIFKTDLLLPMIEKLSYLSQLDYANQPTSFRIIADHWRAATWLALDGVIPSNKEQGYVMRRLIRRAQLQASKLGVKISLSDILTPLICQVYTEAYPEFEKQHTGLIEVLKKEEQVFQRTLKAGLRQFEKLTQKKLLTGQSLFVLYDTYGFPKELSLEEAHRQDITLEDNLLDKFNQLMIQQRQRSQTIEIGSYKGGLADHQPMTIKYHTATHLMYKALKLTLGSEVTQRGSNITTERLRFDFSHKTKVTPEQIAQIEDTVNQQIEADWKITWEIVDTQKALAEGVLGAFGDKYGDKVKVYTVGDPQGKHYSREICGGPHVQRTSQLSEDGRRFKIIKEESSSAGVRRIKAVLK